MQLEQSTQRPTGVAVLSILMFLGGAVDIGIAGLLLFLGAVTLPMLAFLPNLQLAGTFLLLLSIIPLISAIISFVLGFGLWKGRSWAWTWTLISSILGLIVSVAGLITGVGLLGVVIYAIFIFYLTRGRVKFYFGKGAAPHGIEAVAAAPYYEYDQVAHPETIPTQESDRISKERTIGNQNRNRKLAGVLFLLAWIQAIFFISIAEGLDPIYDLRLNFVTDLGVQPQSAIVWTASVVVAGVLVIIASLALSDFGREHRELLVTFALTGVGLLGVAAFNENTFYDAHIVLSLLAFAFGAISSILVSIRLVKGLFRYFSLILGLMMLIGTVILYASFYVAPLASIFFALGKGLAETIVVLPEAIWFITLGAYLIGMSATPSENY